MKKLLFACLFIFSFLYVKPEIQYRLTVIVSEIESTEGNIMIGVYDKAENAFVEEGAVVGKRVTPQKNTMRFVFDLKAGAYAVGVIHDKNEDGMLNRNFLGLPKEPYGFSNNLMLPDFEKALIHLDKDTIITINLR